MSSANCEQPQVPEQLVDQLVKGYDALGTELRLLDEQRRALENRLSWAKQQYLDALKRFNPGTASQDFQTFLGELDEAGNCEPETPSNWLDSTHRSADAESRTRAYHIQRATDAREKIEFRRRASDASNGVRIWNGKSADSQTAGLEMEKDFTTYGSNPGRLKCPFVAPRYRPSALNGTNGRRTPRTSSFPHGSIAGRRSKRSSFHDPIRAEICGNDLSDSVPPSVEGSAPLCPIRFLNQHSPEEVATYFERHKHELPKSHEVCVMRYQTNEASIKELDAKYGNLVTMIQGLGQVHQPMFPEVPAEQAIEDEEDDLESTDRVKRWASNVNASLHENTERLPPSANENALPAMCAEQSEDRQAHFDRQLKDVRVGESPSRPWGIPIPEPRHDMNGSAARSDHTASPRQTPDLISPTQDKHVNQPKKGTCPFNHTQMAAMFDPQPSRTPREQKLRRMMPEPTPPTTHPEMERTPSQGIPASPIHQQPEADIPVVKEALKPMPQMVFNGPVFFGCSMEQAMSMIQKTGGFGQGQ